MIFGALAVLLSSGKSIMKIILLGPLDQADGCTRMHCIIVSLMAYIISYTNVVDTKYAPHSEEVAMCYSINKSSVTHFHRIM